MAILFDKDAQRTQIVHEDVDGLTIETRSNNLGSLIERNKRLQNSGVTPDSMGMRYVGSIDPVVYEQWCKEDPELKHDNKKLIKKLRDPDNRAFLVVDKSKL